jgi:5-methylthioadenosine/S-adenosylhomocysteine deaminase
LNAHVHSLYLLIKGLLEGLRLSEWESSGLFQQAKAWIWTPERAESLRALYRASYLEMLLGGTTFAGEYNRSTGLSREVMEEVGIEGLQTLGVEHCQGREGLETEGWQYALNEEEKLSVEELDQAGRLVREHGARLTMHAAETAERAQLVQDRFGKTTIELLDAHGLLGPWMLLSHAVHLTPTDMQLIAERGAAVVASPSCEMKLADGAGPLAGLLELGVPVGLGTDAAACNNGADMFVEMRTASLLGKLTAGAQALSARQALAMATRDGARALGLEGERGSLEGGKRADMVAVRLDSLRMSPLVHTEARSNLLANLVFCASSADVSDVLVAGEHLVVDAHHRSLDAQAVRRDLEQLSRRLEAHLDTV